MEESKVRDRHGTDMGQTLDHSTCYASWRGRVEARTLHPTTIYTAQGGSLLWLCLVLILYSRSVQIRCRYPSGFTITSYAATS